jgi:pyruvate kinase
MAMDHLEEITRLCDGIMVARGDLGVEMPPEYVPEMQRRMVSTCRRLGKPVVIATQMLESMINSPVPTRAEASDVATAIYEGADTVMLSAESASGSFPVEAISMMDRIIKRVEQDPIYQKNVDAARTAPEATVPDAICGALGDITSLIRPAATITYTSSGFTALRAARERPATPILGLTPDVKTARRLTFCWGVHPLPFQEIDRVQQMIELGCSAAKSEGFAKQGDSVVIIAGLPFGQSGTTNLLHIAKVE